jgi:AraC-like DNA-binding protein
MDSNIPFGENHIQRIVPSGLLELIFYLGNKPTSLDNKKSINSNTLITGHLNEYYDLKIEGKMSLFSIIFLPHGLSAFLNLPIQEIYNQNIPLKYVFKDDVEEIEFNLFEAKSFSKQISIIENYLFNILKKNQINYNFERINSSIFKINQSKGLISIDKLASEACFSRKQYERVFSQFVGSSPKQFLKIVRFQNAIDQKSKNSDLNLSSLAYDCGYYDQAHMINDFKNISGMTPKQYFDDCEAYSDYFQV